VAPRLSPTVGKEAKDIRKHKVTFWVKMKMPESATSAPMLPKILSPEWAAVLVVDVQNDFCHEIAAAP
jgi:hypothetical protein